MLKIINAIGNKKLDTKSTICASSRGGAARRAGTGEDTTGVDCCEIPDMDTAEST